MENQQFYFPGKPVKSPDFTENPALQAYLHEVFEADRQLVSEPEPETPVSEPEPETPVEE